MKKLLTCEGAAFSYDGRQVTTALSFVVEQGDYLCIVGENGSGKSTLMKGLLGLKTPSRGKIHWESGKKQGNVGYLPQQSQIQRDFPASIYEVVLSGCLNRCGIRPFYKRKEKERALEAMNQMGILSMKKRCYKELSGGQQQRVLLARALCAADQLLLLDEPVTGLDPKVTEELYRLIDTVNRERQITVIMVSHDIGGALAHGSKILHLRQNDCFFGTCEEYEKSDAARQFVRRDQDVNRDRIGY